jgi:predicted CXXCH cytochrome family protein
LPLIRRTSPQRPKKKQTIDHTLSANNELSRKGGTIVKYVRKLKSYFTGAIILSAVFGAVAAQASMQPGFAFGNPEKNDPCLRCHSSMTAVGEKSYVDPVRFSQSMHARIGCATCHDSIGATHPDGSRTPIKTACVDCHQTIAEEYSRSMHVKNASCTGCHDPHTVLTLAEVSGAEVKRQCANCHTKTKMSASHSRWLPQADLHLATIPCITCHIESKELMVTINVVKRHGGSVDDGLKPVSHGELKKLARGGNIESLIDTNVDGTVSLSELRSFNFNPLYSEYCLAGVMTPSKISHDFKILNSRWDCTACHAKGPSTIQSSTVAFPTEDGSYKFMTVEKGAVIEALNGIPDFYLMGATRSDLMSKLGLVILGGGMVMPVGHGMLRFLTRKNREGKGH